MIKIPSKIIPFGENKFMTIWPLLIYKEELTQVILNHEKLHEKQYLECGLIGLLVLGLLTLYFGFNWWFITIPFTSFYIIYFFDWLFNKTDRGALEREAYEMEKDSTYFKIRKIFQFWRR
jgi:hypothetical protein